MGAPGDWLCLRRHVALRALPVVLMTMGGVGCKTTPAYQGSQRDVLASYRGRRLSAELPPTVRVPAAVAAAKAALMERGYAIRRSSSTEDSGQVDAVPADAGFMESISVDVRQSSGGTRIQIITSPFGSQTSSRAILDSILTNLGL